MDDPAVEWLKRWQEEDDVEALDQLLRFEIESISARLRKRGGGALGASVSASDLAQEAVLRMLKVEEPPHFEDPKQLRAYLWKAAWRLLINRVQRSGRGNVRLSDAGTHNVGDALAASGGFGKVEDKERALALEFALNLLKPEDRDVLELVYFQHLEIPAAAEKLGIARSALDMRLTRARKRLAKKLMEWSQLIG